MAVPARFRDRVGLLDGLRGVQRPHRKGDRLRRQGICRRRRGRNRRVGLVAGRRFLVPSANGFPSTRSMNSRTTNTCYPASGRSS